MQKIVEDALTAHNQGLDYLKDNTQVIIDIAKEFIESLEKGNKILFMGNGGSAADAQHLTAELVGRFKKNRKALAAIALTTDTSILTSLANDFGFEDVFSRQVEALAKPGDILVGISTSGKSKNVLKALEMGKRNSLLTVGFLGRDGGELLKLSGLALTIPSQITAVIQEMHILAGHIICAIVENHFS